MAEHERKPKDVGICSCCDKEFPDCSLGAFGDDCVLCENCLATGIPKLKEQLAAKDKQHEIWRKEWAKTTAELANTITEKDKEIRSLKGLLHHAQMYVENHEKRIKELEGLLYSADDGGF